MKKDTHCSRLLLATAVISVVAVILTASRSTTVKTDCYEIQRNAYIRMEGCMNAVLGYKRELGIPLLEEDVNKTGLLGEPFNGITTTIGLLEAKRTTADPNMAALIVRMMQEAGLKSGDIVCGNFSGSFPSLNIAVLTACDAMDIDIYYLTSVGSSTYGANNPQLTFPEMAHRLYSDGFIKHNSIMVTAGGDYDVGTEMDQEILNAIKARITKNGLYWYEERDFERNLKYKKAMLDSFSPSCFISAGGNISSMGIGADSENHPQGLVIPVISTRFKDYKSGLIDRYLADGKSVINLLNVKEIVADYGMPFDSMKIAPAGSGNVFLKKFFSHSVIILSFIAVFLPLIGCALIRRQKLNAAKKQSEEILKKS
ncbi:MAG: poly-gamma-glutamate system protein [Candidatus Fimivivens sp.]